jgi:signal transduction histidine kinase
LQFADIDINDAIEDVLRLSRTEFERHRIALHLDFDRSLSKIEADRTQLQQVVVNLVRNAIEAMVDVEERSRVLSVSSRISNDHVLVVIADTGSGIEPSIKERLFDPLNTTKKGGLGLGLSIGRKIVAAHGGRLWVEESAAFGATFAFALPLRRSSLPYVN